jgi:hypothetical protein
VMSRMIALKPVFHFKRTVPKRIKNVFKFQNFRECWLVSTEVVRQKVDLRRTFYFDTWIHPEVRGFINLFSMCACSPVRFATIRAMWKTGFRIGLEYPRALMANTVVYTSVYLVSHHFLSINRPQD